MINNTVVITGATSGLGRATALQLAKKGASVVGVARNNHKASKVLKEIENEGGRGQFFIADLSCMKDTEEAAQRISKSVDRLDVLINNAGAHFPKYSVTSEGFESTLALNYLSPFLFTHHLADQMQQTASRYGYARIINISSIMHKAPIGRMALSIQRNEKGITSHFREWLISAPGLNVICLQIIVANVKMEG